MKPIKLLVFFSCVFLVAIPLASPPDGDHGCQVVAQQPTPAPIVVPVDPAQVIPPPPPPPVAKLTVLTKGTTTIIKTDGSDYSRYEWFVAPPELRETSLDKSIDDLGNGRMAPKAYWLGDPGTKAWVTFIAIRGEQVATATIAVGAEPEKPKPKPTPKPTPNPQPAPVVKVQPIWAIVIDQRMHRTPEQVKAEAAVQAYMSQKHPGRYRCLDRAEPVPEGFARFQAACCGAATGEATLFIVAEKDGAILSKSALPKADAAVTLCKKHGG